MRSITRGGAILAAAALAFGFGPYCGDGGREPEHGTESRREWVELEVLVEGIGGDEIAKDGPSLDPIESEEGLEAALELVGYTGEGFDIDFTESIVLLAHAGPQAHSGVEFRFTEAIDTGGRILVRFALIDHLEGYDAIAYPYVFLKAPRTDKPYEMVTRSLHVR